MRLPDDLRADLGTIARDWAVTLLCLGIALGVLLPWQFGGVSLYTAQRLAQLMMLALMLGVVGWPLRDRLYDTVSSVAGPWRMLALGGAGLAVAAVVLSPLPGIALLELSYLLVLGMTAVLVTLSARLLSRGGWLMIGVLLALFMLVYTALAIDSISLVWTFANLHDLGPGFANVRFFADVAVGVMPLAVLYGVARVRPSLVAAVLLVPVLASWWWLLWVSESRAALLGLFSGGAVALWLLGRAARWPVGIHALSGTLGLLGWWFLNPIGGGAAEEAFVRDIASSSGRMALWADALRYSLENASLGIGPMMFAGDSQLRSAHAHHFFFNTAAEWGLPLALLLLALLLYGCRVIIRRARTMPLEDKPIYACLVIAFVGGMVNAQFAGSHINPLGALVLVLAIGLVFGHRSGDESPSSEPTGPVPPGTSRPIPLRATLLWVALMLIFAYLLFAGLALYWLSADSASTCFQEQGRAYYYPRFWVQGRLECMQLIDPKHWLFRVWLN